MRWTAADIPDHTGRTIVVTGPTSGLGRATAIALATRGAHVVMAARSAERSAALIEHVRQRAPFASLSRLSVDLADLSSIRAAARRLAQQHDRIDALVANAGIMAPPLTRTSDGFELQLGVNHLGHAALTARLLPLLRAAARPRVVVVSSTLHRIGRIDPDDLNWEARPYDRWAAYGQSKLANLLYVLELQRRFDAAGVAGLAVGAHPGWADTALQTSGLTPSGRVRGALWRAPVRLANLLFSQPASRGALPQLYATTAADVPGGSYWGPDGPGEQMGYPAPATRSPEATNPDLARQLWHQTEAFTGVSHDLGVEVAP